MNAATPMSMMPATGSRVVLRHGEAEFGDQLGARDVWVWAHGGTYFMHYDAAGAQGWLAALATSRDGLTWRKHGPALSLGGPGSTDSASASYGTVFQDESHWHMFYLGTPNATDDDLRTPSFPYLTLKAIADSPYGPWRKQELVPFSTQAGTWYSETASPGHIVRRDLDFLMIFSASTTIDGQIYRTLGTATTPNLGGPWTICDEPALPLTEQIENSSLYYEPSNGYWFLFTNHIGTTPDHPAIPPQQSNEYTDAIWVYWSTDPSSWQPENKALVLDAAATGWSPRVVGLPSVLPIDGRLAVFYDGLVADSISHGNRDVAVAWLDLPLIPPTRPAGIAVSADNK